MNLNMCDRLQGEGAALILQSCAIQNYSISAKKTRCGYQPWIEINNASFGISKDGWTLVPFSDCVWHTPFISINDKIYRYLDETWIEFSPSIHVSNLKLVARFDELLLHQYDLTSYYYNIYDNSAMDSLTLMADMIGQSTGVEPEAVQRFVDNLRNGVFSDAISWLDYIRYTLIAIIAFIIISVVVRIVVIFNPLPALSKFFRSLSLKRKRPTANAPAVNALSAQYSPVPTNVSYANYPSTSGAIMPFPHNHNDTVYIPGRGVFFADMCPLSAVNAAAAK